MTIGKSKNMMIVCAHPDCLAGAVFASPVDYGDYCRFHWIEKKNFWKGIWPPPKPENYSKKEII